MPLKYIKSRKRHTCHKQRKQRTQRKQRKQCKQHGGMDQKEVEDFLEEIDAFIVASIGEDRITYPELFSEESITELEKLNPMYALYRGDFDIVMKRILEEHYMGDCNSAYNAHNPIICGPINLSNEVEGDNIEIPWNASGDTYFITQFLQVIEPKIRERLEEIKDKQQLANIIYKMGKGDLGHVILRLLATRKNEAALMQKNRPDIVNIRADGDDEEYLYYNFTNNTNHVNNNANYSNNNKNQNGGGRKRRTRRSRQ